MTKSRIAARGARRERRATHPLTAWRDLAGAMSRANRAQLRFAELAESMRLVLDEHRLASEDAEEAMRRIALPLDRDDAA